MRGQVPRGVRRLYGFGSTRLLFRFATIHPSALETERQLHNAPSPPRRRDVALVVLLWWVGSSSSQDGSRVSGHILLGLERRVQIHAFFRLFTHSSIYPFDKNIYGI